MNIFVANNGTTLLIGDFGFSTTHEFLTPATFCGSHAYMAPQAFSLQTCSTPLNDLWAFGITSMFIVLAGYEPWTRAIGSDVHHTDFDPQYEQYRNNPSVLLERFPISKEFGAFVQSVLHPSTYARPDLRTMMDEIMMIKHFLLTPEELGSAPPEAQMIAMMTGLVGISGDKEGTPESFEGYTVYESAYSYDSNSIGAGTGVLQAQDARLSTSCATLLGGDQTLLVNEEAPFTFDSNFPSTPLLLASSSTDSDTGSETTGPDTPETFPLQPVSGDKDVPPLEDFEEGDLGAPGLLRALHADTVLPVKVVAGVWTRPAKRSREQVA